MADKRKPYTVRVGSVEHTFLLSPEDAERYGDNAVEVKAAERPSNKDRTPSVRNK